MRPCRPAVPAIAFALLLLPQASQGAEPDAVAGALAAALGASIDGEVTVGEARAEGGDVVIVDLTFSAPEDEAELRFARTVIEAPRELADGAYESPRIEMSEGMLSGEASGTVASAVAMDVTILSEEAIAEQQLLQGLLYRILEVTDIRVVPGEEPGEITVERVTLAAGNVVDNVPQSASGSVQGINVPATAFGNGMMSPQALGYETMRFEISWDGERDPETRALSVDDLTIRLQEGGSLALSGRLGNVALGDPQDPMAAFAAAGELTVHEVAVRYEDDSLARRILDAVGQTQGMSGEEYGEQLAMALPFLLGGLGNPQFQAQLAAEVGAFLRNPGTLTIRLEPEEPLSGAQIMEIAGSAPHTLPDRLNVIIETAAP